jgi:GxxExxY protein
MDGISIRSDINLQSISYEDFHIIDYEVMGIIFSIHREMGRFWDEKIYREELAYRCRSKGKNNVYTEIPIKVTFDTFVKLYYIDVLVDNIIYELKTIKVISKEHEKQAINYLMLTGQNHGKIVNMRPPSVQHYYVSTNITRDLRFDFTIEDGQWVEFDDNSVRLKSMFLNLLRCWGVFLETTLYTEAITHFLGGEEIVIRALDVKSGSRLIGRQNAHMISPDTAFKISAVTKNVMQYEKQIRRFIGFTSLKAVQWINFNRKKVFLKTILNK